MLLFGRSPQSHLRGSYALFSIYPGSDRSEPHAERHEVAGTLVDQVRRIKELLDVQSYTAFDKTDAQAPNALKYPVRALHEGMINVLAHRDYEINEPSRFTVFADRIEMMSPGSLPSAVSLDTLRQGRAIAKWRNQSLAWFLNRLQLAQAEGQGIPTILRSMRDEGCPPPVFEANEVRVVCILPAHPRHAMAREHRHIEEAISLGYLERAQLAIAALLAQDPLNARTLQLFAEAQRALGDPAPVRDFLLRHEERIPALPPAVQIQMADALAFADQATDADLALARRIYWDAAQHRMSERQTRQAALGLSKADDDDKAVLLLDRAFAEQPEFRDNPSLLRIRGNAFIGLAKRCSQTGRGPFPTETRARAWEDCKRFLERAELDLSRARGLTTEPSVREGIQKNMDFVSYLRQIAMNHLGR